MRTLLAALFLCSALSQPATAQVAGVVPLLLKGRTVAPAGYTGPGDIQTFASWYGAYAYSAAKRGTNAVQVCNAANSTCVDVVSDATTGIVPNPSPGGTPCNTSSNICTVKIWYDQAAGSAGNLTQTTVANRSVWLPAGNCTGLGASISCGNGTAARYVSAGTITQAQPFSFVWVSNRNTSTGTDTTVFGIGGAISAGAGFFGANNDAICNAGNGGLDTTATDGSWHAIGCAVNGASSNLKVDSGTVTSANAGTNVASSSAFGLLTSPVNGNDWQGKFAGGGVAFSNFSTTDLANLNANAHTILGF